jgi:hypothetical protein
MMNRRSTSRGSSASPQKRRSATPKPRRSRSDRDAARHLLEILKAGGDARVTKIKRVRQKVRTRSYENDLKLSVAIDAILGGGVLSES